MLNPTNIYIKAFFVLGMYEIVIGRNEKDRKTFGLDGTILLGKHFVKQIKSAVAELDKTAKKKPIFYYSGPFKIAVQEFVEAVCYYEFVKNKKIPSAKELKVDTEYYLLGLCDLTGELVRKAINSAINNDYDQALFIKKFVNDLYNELMLFEFRNELRKKFDSIKYDLKKLDELALGIKLKK